MADSSSSRAIGPQVTLDGSAAQPPYLSIRAPERGFAFGQALKWVREREGKGALRQTLELFWLSAARKFVPDEYYLLGLFRRDLGRQGLRSFVSHREGTALNHRLNGPALTARTSLVNDKLLCGFLFEAIGLQTPRLIGHASTLFRFQTPRTLSTPEALVDLWRQPGALPCFGKPVHSSRALGTASLVAISDDGGIVTLGNGRQVPALPLAAEILATYSDGYLFQELLMNEASLARAIGPTVAGVRIVTVQSADGPKPLYAVIRMPAPGAMNDATAGGRQVRAAVDVATGRILRAQDMYRMSIFDQQTHPETGATLPGLTLPDWPQAIDMVLRGHQIFAEAGIIGWDVLLTDRGPVLCEANANPLHLNYQRPFGRGLLNPDLRPLIDGALAFAAARRGRT